MQAIILAAGEGTRMRPLTNFVPKPMVRFMGADGVRRNLVEHNLGLLPKEVDELIFVVGYLKEQIINHFGDEFNGRKVRYVVQDKPLGTGHAVSLAQQYIKGRFLVMMSDDLYCKADIDAVIEAGKSAILVQKVQGEFSGGNVELDIEGNLLGIAEGMHDGGFINAALYAITPEYLEYPMAAIKNGAEYGLPQTLVVMAQDTKVKVIEATWWQQITDMDDVKNASNLINGRV